MGKRRLAREFCLQALYLSDTGRLTREEITSALAESFRLDAPTREFAGLLLAGTIENLPELDRLITEYAKNWSLTRMSAVDRSILRMSVYEIVYGAGTPVPAIIDEAIELAKKFSTENSGSFINGLLDRMKNERIRTAGGK
ncbi:MAG: transcription antitermination factor NusB [Elusimicrobiaceae bacterium]|nr:transcription antitermination factor NusB [Elusimicrobiaceae bacterium]